MNKDNYLNSSNNHENDKFTLSLNNIINKIIKKMEMKIEVKLVLTN